MTMRKFAGVFAALVLTCGPFATAVRPQADPFARVDPKQIYSRLLPLINKIPIFDNHSHPGFPDDPDVDAMTSPPGNPALRIRSGNPELIAASKALFAYPFEDFSPQHARWLIEKKAHLKTEGGTEYFSRILNKVGIQTAVANRVAMPDYLDRNRFLWVPFADSFLFPLNNARVTARNIDEQTFIPLQEKLLHRELASAGRSTIPASFAEYLKFITQILNDDKNNGAIGIKFEIAYFRSLYFADPARHDAETIYEKYRGGQSPADADYTVFQDYIFRYLLSEASRLEFAVHFHTAVGVGDFFSLRNGNVLNLENILRDPRYGDIRFVLLHGGFPYDRQAIWLAARANVTIDSSLADLYLYPSEFKNVLKYWLSTYPEKVVFGSDAFPFSEALGAEEAYWLSVRSSRTALAAALSELIAEGAFSQAQALKIAHGYLHDNAAALYK